MPKANKQKPSGPPTIQNRRARHDFEILDTFEAGIVLEGSEVKSILRGDASLVGAFCKIEQGEIWIEDMEIAPYSHTSNYAPDRRRKRKLLLHKAEIRLLKRKIEEKGLTIIPLKIYYANRKVKVQIGVARGKKLYDKRQTIKEKDIRRGRAE